MTKENYLLDTHALIFWQNNISISDDLVNFLDANEGLGRIFLSSISFWEIALLVRKKKLDIIDIHGWRNELLNNSTIVIIEPTMFEMVESTTLPDHHKDPFDRLLIVQANQRDLVLISQDRQIQKYEVKCFWI